MARVRSTQMEFGGPWTKVKLAALESYLPAYTRILTKNSRARHFSTMYVDAFAGSGRMQFIPTGQAKLFEGSEQISLKGSATRALEVRPEFNQYIFIETKKARCNQLLQLKQEFPEKQERIHVHNTDANAYLINWCAITDWNKWRAVVLLDPFAMNVSWETVETLAKTQAVDMWWLFPCGAFNRLLTKGKKPPPNWSAALTRICGTTEWEERFYKSNEKIGLFGPIRSEDKTAGFELINQFLRERLASVFAGVVDRPLFLVNSNNSPIFMLFFASSNPKGASTAVRIANWVIRHSGN
jgi:three-Cys-motif partner protein